MHNNRNWPGFFGALYLSSIEFDSAESAAGLRQSGASVHMLENRSALLATWNILAPNFAASRDGLAVVMVGNPRWIGPAPVELTSANCVAAQTLGAYRTEGADVLKNLAGSFALAIVDGTNSEILLAVDRIGIESLFYASSSNGAVFFASSIDILQAHADVGRCLNHQAIYDYAYYHAVPSPLTIYSDISKIPPSHQVVGKHGNVDLGRYWLPDFNSSLQVVHGDAEGSLLDVLRRAVARDASPKDVGGFLSGGLDSSTVCGLLSEIRGGGVPAVSVGFDVEGYDEIAFARIAAKHFNIDHHVHYMSPDEIADSIPNIVKAYCEPFGNSSVIPTYVCASVAKENGISTLLAGDGGDELFAGNARYAKQLLFEQYFKLPGFLRRSVIEPLLGDRLSALEIGPLRKLGRYIDQARIPLPDRLQTYNLLEMRSPAVIFTNEFIRDIDVSHPLNLLRDEYRSTHSDPLNSMLHCDWRFTLADNDLRKVTKTCQLAGVDVRFPLLDDEVVNFSVQIPPSIKLKGQQLRFFYKKALTEFLPREVIEKPKHGFGLPFGEWLISSDQLQDMVYDALSDVSKRSIFRQDFIGALIDDHREGHAAFYGNMVWVLAMLEWWLAAHSPNVSLSQ